MSWVNIASLTPRGSGNAEWQSRQEFLVCAKPKVPSSSRTASGSERAGRSESALFCQVSINTHTCYVSQSKDCKSGNPAFGRRGVFALEKWQQKPQQGDCAEGYYTQNLPVDEPHFGGNQLQRLEHEEEIPLGFDSGRRGHKRIRLDPQVPWEDGRQSAQHSQSYVPGHQFAQREVGKKLHFTPCCRICAPLR